MHVFLYKWNQKPESWEWINELSDVVWSWTTMGDYDVNIWVKYNSTAKLQSFIEKKLNSYDWINSTKITLVQKVY